MKKLLFAALLISTAIYVSGCATIIGGIIGYQSGELLAGAAIGAGVDFGGHIVNGVGEMLADPEKDITKTKLDSVRGRITLPKVAFNPERLASLSENLQGILVENQWQVTLQEKKVRTGNTLFFEKWLCKTADGTDFELTIQRVKCKKPTITITTLNQQQDQPNKTSEITIQVHNWLPQAVKQ